MIHLPHPGRQLPHRARLPPVLAAHVTSPDQAPGLQQQHHVCPLQVLGAVGAKQPRGVAQHSQDAPVQQMGGHVCIHGGQRVVEEIEFLFLGGGSGDAMGARSSDQNPDLS